ncbi:alpha/beta hydrolase [Chryseobacterium sp. CBSDS_008]|uniref:alpha/beta hydrolase n=1 Tax=Chryseobacterium sp. CBSDS_008 TaxID=3415265 RepID=UPI003CF84D3C
MKKLLTLFFTVYAMFSFSQDRKEIGDTFIRTLLADKNIEKAHAYFDPSVAGQIPVEQLKSITEQLQTQLGEFKNILEVNNQGNIYYYYTEFEKTKLDIQLTFAENNKMLGFFLVPHKTFEKPDEKTTLKIKSDDIELNGTLLVPPSNDKKRLVIFVHGSGAHDRDETIGENKPFKDIAEYLLHNGIASYRYDKRNYSYPETFNEKSTVEEETINDAVNAASYFKNNPDYKGYEIIILGHSQGAYMMPEIAKRAQASKYIFMAGNARPLQNLLVEQYEYLHTIDPAKVPAEAVQEIKKQVTFLNSSEFNVNSPASELPLGQSAAYWKYVKDYNQLNEVKKIKVPMFFAQGGRDYQVTEKDFNLWKQALKNNKAAVFMFYPSLSHLFIAGSGKPSPKDYDTKGKVDEQFLRDLIQFILK